MSKTITATLVYSMMDTYPFGGTDGFSLSVIIAYLIVRYILEPTILICKDSVKECSQKPSYSEITKRFCSTVVEFR